MNKAGFIKMQIRELERSLEQIQNNCKHPNLVMDISDDLFSDPFAQDGIGFSGLQEYTCPDCLMVIVK